MPKYRTGARVFLLVALVAAAGCAGYRNDTLFPGNARRIAVPIFENDTFFRQIEFDLTRSVCEELRARPGIHVTAPEEADLILVGRITELDQKVLSITKAARPTETAAQTTVQCELIDARTAKKVKSFVTSERVDFALQTGEGLQTAQRESFYNLARKIVFELEADW